MKVIMMQDQMTQAAVHEAYKSRYAPRGKLAGLEAAIPQLNQWSLERYRRGLADLRCGAFKDLSPERQVTAVR